MKELDDTDCKEFRQRFRKKKAAFDLANSPATFALAKKSIEDGISITTHCASELAEIWRPTGKGRPKANVFEHYPLRKGLIKIGENISIPAKRRGLLSDVNRRVKRGRSAA